jgi:predicted nucleic acid-binding protein
LSTYADTSVLVSLFVDDALTPSAQGYLSAASPVLVVSDFAVAEFASALGNRVRSHMLSLDDARLAITDFDRWRARDAVSETMSAPDVAEASSILRRFDLVLRTPDALHLAMALRLKAELATLDVRMANAARVLGLAVAAI